MYTVYCCQCTRARLLSRLLYVGHAVVTGLGCATRLHVPVRTCAACGAGGTCVQQRVLQLLQAGPVPQLAWVRLLPSAAMCC